MLSWFEGVAGTPTQAEQEVGMLRGELQQLQDRMELLSPDVPSDSSSPHQDKVHASAQRREASEQRTAAAKRGASRLSHELHQIQNAHRGQLGELPAEQLEKHLAELEAQNAVLRRQLEGPAVEYRELHQKNAELTGQLKAQASSTQKHLLDLEVRNRQLSGAAEAAQQQVAAVEHENAMLKQRVEVTSAQMKKHVVDLESQNCDLKSR